MSHRANAALLLEGRLYPQTSRWGAVSLPDMLIVGPDATIRSLACGTPVASVAEADFYDVADCEGFYCVDVDRRLLLFDFGQSEIPREAPMVARLFTDLLLARWPGWALRLVGHTAGNDWTRCARYLDGRLGGPTLTPDAVWERLTDDPSRLAEHVHRPDDDDFRGTLIRLETGPGASRLLLVPYSAHWPLSYGPSLAQILESVEPARAIDPTVPRHAFVHLDATRRRLLVWQAIEQFQLLDALPQRWPGWRIEKLEQADLAREGLPGLVDMPPEARTKLQEALATDHLGRMLASIRSVAARLADEGHQVTVDPSVLKR